MTNGGFECTSAGRPTIYHFGVTCNVICDPGYEIIGDEMWICQSDGSWNASEAMCGRGI